MKAAMGVCVAIARARRGWEGRNELYDQERNSWSLLSELPRAIDKANAERIIGNVRDRVT